MFVIHRVAALPTECIFGFDQSTAIGTRSDTRLFLLWRRRRCGFRFFVFRYSLNWRLLDHGRLNYRRHYWPWLRLLLDDFEQSGLGECPTISGVRYKSRFHDLHIAGVRVRTVIIVLIVLVEITLRGKLCCPW